MLPNVLATWLPLTAVAIVLSVSISIIYYLLGYLLNNTGIKQKAITEIGQAIGTAVIVIGIIIVLELWGGTLISPVSVLSPATSNQICNSLSASPIAFLNSQQEASPTNIICTNIVAPVVNGKAGTTTIINYGLGASFLIIANVTNQDIQNLNAIYIFDWMTSFLRGFSSATTISLLGEGIDITYTYGPLAGYNFLVSMISGILIVSEVVFYSFTLQMLVLLLALISWPYFLAAGIILRAIPYTRRIGGTLIGITLGILIFLPFLLLFEYAALSSSPQPIGTSSNSIPYLPIYEKINGKVIVYGSTSSQSGYAYQTSVCPNGYVYESVCGDTNTAVKKTCTTTQPTGNLCPAGPPSGSGMTPFILPNATAMLQYYGCWPFAGSMPTFEALFSGFYLIPFYGLIFGGISLIGYAFGSLFTSLPVLPLSVLGCTPQNAIEAALTFPNIYGVTAVTAFLLPLLNIMIMYSASMGLSRLLGGDTDLFGIGKLL